eukprot:GHRR01031811.1.p2 GENE.GHRR01031811.1~~GHRR01031811.1.p2  ORF type:complete len:155 (-),score=26.41 GHRR01031811.1:1021-1485(-)
MVKPGLKLPYALILTYAANFTQPQTSNSCKLWPWLTAAVFPASDALGAASPRYFLASTVHLHAAVHSLIEPTWQVHSIALSCTTSHASCRNITPYLTQLHLADNDFEGDLSAVAAGHLTTVTVYNNPKLCGMVPATVRYAKNYNPAGTRLGQPC